MENPRDKIILITGSGKAAIEKGIGIMATIKKEKNKAIIIGHAAHVAIEEALRSHDISDLVVAVAKENIMPIFAPEIPIVSPKIVGYSDYASGKENRRRRRKKERGRNGR